jgi:hypothetical protein
MARSRSPSLSFEPTPAIPVDKETSLSPDNANEKTSANRRGSIDKTSKEVHFSPADPVARRTQSLATAVPLLEPISSASQVPRPSFNDKSATSSVDMEAYVQQSRAVLQTQRLNFERERKLFEEERKLFEGERKLWNAERALLKAKILDLEAAVAKSKGGKRKYGTDSVKSSSQSFRSSSFTSTGRSGMSSTSNTSPPVWEGPEHMAPASRVFSEPNTFATNPFTEDQIKHMNGHLPSISENGSFPTLEREISPFSAPPERVMSIPIPIDKIDKSLDGITLKSTALAPSFVAKIVTPDVITPQRSPSPNSKPAGAEGLRVAMDELLSPLDEKLKLHAGHTPMAFETASSTGPASTHSTEIPTPVQEQPPAPVPTASRPPPRPTEHSDSYFSPVAKEDQEQKRNDDNKEERENEDPELKGPLTLSNKNEDGQSNDFLNTLDAKLMMEAKRYVKSPESTQSDDNDPQGASGGPQDDEGPRLRMRNSTNFGSAFGSNRCGNI